MRDGVWAAAAGGLLLLQTVLIVRHQPWHDEWHALMIAVRSQGWSGLLENLRYEGHTPLWYAMLDAARRLVPDRWALVAVQLPIALALQAVILFRSPFAPWQRLCIGASFFVLIDYGMISRSLSLGVLVATIGANARDRRTGSLLLGALPAVDIIFAMLSLPLFALRLRERRLWWPGVALWLASSLSMAWMLRAPPDMVPAMQTETPGFGTLHYIVNLSVLLVPLHWWDGGLVWNHSLPIPVALIVGPLFLLFALRQMPGRPAERAIFAGFVAMTMVFSMAVYPLAIRYLSLIAWLLILIQWRMVARGGRVDQEFKVWIATAAACGLVTAGVNFVRPFDNAAATFAYIQDHQLANQSWTVFPEYQNESLTALSGIAFVRLGADCTQGFMRWDRRPVIEDRKTLDRALRRLVAIRGRSYLLSSIDLGRFFSRRFLQPLTVIPAGYNGQTNYLYVIAPGDLPKDAVLPDCSAFRTPLLPLKPLA